MARGTSKAPFKFLGIKKEDIKFDSFIPGGLGIASTLFRGAQRRKKERQDKMDAAEAEVARRMAAFEQAEFQTVNPYEDLTVNLQAAEFQRQQQAQEQADILAGLQTAAGGAGAASLATAMARQSQMKQQQIAADIGKQELAIQSASAQAELAEQQAKRQFEIGRMETMLGISMEKVAGLEAAEQARKDRNAQIGAAALGIVGDITGAAITASDRSLKYDINLIGKSNSGINIYSFKYKDKKHGSGTYQGVMSNEVPSYAVINNGEYDLVNYSLIDVDFKEI